jgi:S1-C subfamily serine protease
MQIVTSPAGIVINTIQLGSEADLAGFEPGDRIARIDDHEIDSIDQIRRVAAKVRLGKPVVIAVLRSSVPVPAASLPMTERPTIHP